MLFFFNFLFRFGLERNGTIIFIFSLSRPFPTCFDSKESYIMVFFNFLNFFAIIFEFSITLRVGTKRNGKFYILSFLGTFQSVLAWNDAKMVLLNFFAIFLEFSITRRVGTERNDNFYFFSFSAFSNLFWLGMRP